MLNVPDRIKELLHTDSVNKNIRIHFPNGERADICNDQIVQDSVQFTESLCSQNTLKFGLCESPIFQCTVVGVSNITGATIEVFCEIYCESSVEDAEWKNDLEAYVYSIPYGTFIVDTAKRQADMIHRKIVAYSGLTAQNIFFTDASFKNYRTLDVNGDGSLYYYYFIFKDANNNQEILKNGIAAEESVSFNFCPIKRLCSRMNALVVKDATFTEYTNYDMGEFSFAVNLSENVRVLVKVKQRMIFEDNPNLFYLNISPAKMGLKAIYDDLSANLGELCEQKSYTDYTDMLEVLNDFIFKGYVENQSATFGLYGFTRWDGRDNGATRQYFFSGLIDKEKTYFYPQRLPNNGQWGYSIDINVPKYIRIDYKTGNTYNTYYTLTIRDNLPSENDVCKLYTVSHDLFNLYSMSQTSLKRETSASNREGWYLKQVLKDADYQNWLKLVCDLQGVLVRVTRDNNLEPINLQQQFGLLPDASLYPNTNLYPQGVTGGELLPNDYQSCWYNDEYAKPYGAVRCTYTNTSNNQVTYTLYLTGFNDASDTNSYLVYDVSDNGIISGSQWTKAQIRSLLVMITANLSGVRYMPVEFIGRGLPYVEAGDTFEILTKSNDSITTIVLNRTLSGEQVLTDSYKSV